MLLTHVIMNDCWISILATSKMTKMSDCFSSRNDDDDALLVAMDSSNEKHCVNMTRKNYVEILVFHPFPFLPANAIDCGIEKKIESDSSKRILTENDLDDVYHLVVEISMANEIARYVDRAMQIEISSDD